MLSGGEGGIRTPVRVLGGRVQLLCSGSFDGPPLKEAFNGDDEAALGIGRAGLRPPLGSLQPCGIRPQRKVQRALALSARAVNCKPWSDQCVASSAARCVGVARVCS